MNDNHKFKIRVTSGEKQMEKMREDRSTQAQVTGNILGPELGGRFTDIRYLTEINYSHIWITDDIISQTKDY